MISDRHRTFDHHRLLVRNIGHLCLSAIGFVKSNIQCVTGRVSHLNESMTTLSNQTASGDDLKASVSCGTERGGGSGSPGGASSGPTVPTGEV